MEVATIYEMIYTKILFLLTACSPEAGVIIYEHYTLPYANYTRASHQAAA